VAVDCERYPPKDRNLPAMARLERYVALAPLHQPNNLAPIRSLLASRPDLTQIACFDTAFHRLHDAVTDHYAIPEHFYREGIRRYGFHGLSYEFVASRLSEMAPGIAKRRVIVAHLGSGASMCAVADGRSVDSTMGFTALDGLPMGTRSGQIDPGALLYMLTEKGMSAEAVQDLLYRESGLKGLSGLSNDMRELEANIPVRRWPSTILFIALAFTGRREHSRARRSRRVRFHCRHRREFRHDSRPRSGKTRLVGHYL
jgi:acetate kinase